jgi:thioredoxin-related protein
VQPNKTADAGVSTTKRQATCVLAVVVAAIAMGPASAQRGAPTSAEGEIAASVATAKKDGKSVLIDFGADWCVDCKVLDRILKDPSVAPFLEEHFHLVRVDLGCVSDFGCMNGSEIRNADVAAKYGVTDGIPALVLLGDRGQVIPLPRGFRWWTARGFTAEQVLIYLKELAKLPHGFDHGSSCQHASSAVNGVPPYRPPEVAITV